MFLSDLSTQTSLAYISLRFLVFPSVLVIVGGFVANVIYPRVQDRYLRKKAFTERKSLIAEDIAAEMNTYITSWRRLVDTANYAHQRQNELLEESDGNLSPSAEAELDACAERMATFAESRNVCRDKLHSSLSRCRLYCDENEQSIIEDYLRWDEAQVTKSLEDLPTLKDWRLWERKLLAVSQQSLR